MECYLILLIKRTLNMKHWLVFCLSLITTYGSYWHLESSDDSLWRTKDDVNPDRLPKKTFSEWCKEYGMLCLSSFHTYSDGDIYTNILAMVWVTADVFSVMFLSQEPSGIHTCYLLLLVKTSYKLVNPDLLNKAFWRVTHLILFYVAFFTLWLYRNRVKFKVLTMPYSTPAYSRHLDSLGHSWLLNRMRFCGLFHLEKGADRSVGVMEPSGDYVMMVSRWPACSVFWGSQCCVDLMV